MIYFFPLPILAASQSGHLEAPTWINPPTISNAVYHEIFQKLQTFKSCSRNKTPSTSTTTPVNIMHFLHIHIFNHHSAH